jgi:hypothetical protein
MADVTRLTVVPNHLDAEMLSAALRSGGIKSFTKLTDVAAGSWGDAPGVGGGPLEVWVNVDDLDRARVVRPHRDIDRFARGTFPSTGPCELALFSAATKELNVLRNRPDDLNQLLAPVALLAREFQEFLSAGNNGAPFSRAGDGDPTTAAELEQPLVT